MIVSIVGGLLCLSLFVGSLAYLWAKVALTSHLDDALAAKARALSMLVESDGSTNIHFEYEGHGDANPDKTFQYEVFLPDGRSLSKSAALGNYSLPRLSGTIETPAAVTTTLPGNVQGRAVGFEFDPVIEIDEVRSTAPPGERKAAITVVRDTRELELTLSNLIGLIAGFISVLLLGAVGVVILAVSRGLIPVHALAKQVAGIDASSLNTRIDPSSQATELLPIVQRLNELLGRLNAAFEREKRFAMDASHELRTPLAETRTALEVGLQWPEKDDLLIRSAQHALEATYQMENLVAALLSLTRAESDDERAPQEAIVLQELLERAWAQCQGSAERRLDIRDHNPDSSEIFASKVIVTAIIVNLLSNAIKYSPENSAVICDISADAVADNLVLSIKNSMATPLTPQDLDHIFEPLWRKDKSRTADLAESNAHFGIGLALVKAYCEKLSIPIQAQIAKNNMFRMELRLARYTHKA
jgi:signal transduction histidine kinase